MDRRQYLITVIVISFVGIVVGWELLGSDAFIPLAVGTGIFAGWLLYTLVQDVGDLYARRPKLVWSIVLGTGVYMLVCLSLAYTFAAEQDPRTWLIIPYSLGLPLLSYNTLHVRNSVLPGVQNS
jgi:hypothetical protein